ncbi:hypothetical protein FG379_000867 [Cryptosporidium bovis]|uniref:uncharacterized protein n=1 Tax=Cryptosporidium bovis TaxID=310047 RepID=UPI00351A7713|nr:hypothetical protein FG379_000867 [Cryptosporidium bovis]
MRLYFFELILFLVVLSLGGGNFVRGAKFWKPLLGLKKLTNKPEPQNLSGTLIVDYCSVLTPQQMKLSNLFIIASKKHSNDGISLLDSCFIVYTLRDGYFSGCEKAIELTINDINLREARFEICRDVLETARSDPDLKDLVFEAAPDEVESVIARVESTLIKGFDELGNESCSMLTEEELSMANALTLILLEEGYKLSRIRACTVLLSLREGSLDDCAKTLRSALGNVIEYSKAEGFCRELGRFAPSKSHIFTKTQGKESVMQEEVINKNTKMKIETNEAVLAALAIDNRIHLDELDVKRILFVDYPSNRMLIDRRQLYDRFLMFYSGNKISSTTKRLFKEGTLTEEEEGEVRKTLLENMEVINLTNQQALQTLYSTYRNLITSFKETQIFVQDVYFQRKSVPESLKRRFYMQIQLIKYMEKHIGALSTHIEMDNTDILSARNLPYGISDIRQYSELGEKNWLHSLINDKPYNEMDHFSLFCPLLNKSAFRLALLVVGIAHGAFGKKKVKLSDACLAISQLKESGSYKDSIKLALGTVFVTNQKILTLEELDTMYFLLISAVDESVNEFLFGAPEEYFSLEKENDITDEKLKLWIGQAKHRLEKVINNPKAIIGNISLLDVDMIMQSITQAEARIQLQIVVAIRKIHDALLALTEIEEEIRVNQNKLDFARIQSEHSDEINMSKVGERLLKERESVLDRVMDLVVEHAEYCVKAIEIFDISDRPVVRKIHRIIAVNTELKRLNTNYVKTLENTPIYKSNKFLLRTSILKHRIEQARKVLTELTIGEFYNIFDTRFYTSIGECFNNLIPDIGLKLSIDPNYPLDTSHGFKAINSKKPPVYNILCDKNQIKRFKIVQGDLIEILKHSDIPLVDFEGKRPIFADILTLEGWGPLKTTIEERDELNIPCSISKQLFRKLVSDLSQRVIGGTSFFNIPLVHLWCADHIRFRKYNQALWRNIVSRLWLVFQNEPFDIVKLKERRWTLLSWFR